LAACRTRRRRYGARRECVVSLAVGPARPAQTYVGKYGPSAPADLRVNRRAATSACPRRARQHRPDPLNWCSAPCTSEGDPPARRRASLKFARLTRCSASLSTSHAARDINAVHGMHAVHSAKIPRSVGCWRPARYPSRAAETTARAASWTSPRCSGPLNDSA